MQTVTELLKPANRKILYIVYGLLGVGFGATQTAFLTAATESPLWLTIAYSVYMYVGVAFGLVAAQNVDSREVVVTTPEALTDAGQSLAVDDTTYLGEHGVIDTEVNLEDASPETVIIGELINTDA